MARPTPGQRLTHGYFASQLEASPMLPSIERDDGVPTADRVPVDAVELAFSWASSRASS